MNNEEEEEEEVCIKQFKREIEALFRRDRIDCGSIGEIWRERVDDPERQEIRERRRDGGHEGAEQLEAAKAKRH